MKVNKTNLWSTALCFALLTSSSIPLKAAAFKPAKDARVAVSFQVREVKGTVTDSHQKPLAQVIVNVKGSDLSVKTDEKGYFRIKLPTEFEGLSFQLEGFKSHEARITGFEAMNISLQADGTYRKKKSPEKVLQSAVKDAKTSAKNKFQNSNVYAVRPKKFEEVHIQPTKHLLQDYDVCIYGASSAGVVAAYSAAKLGKKVLLVATGDHIGGLSSGGLGQTDIGNKHVVKGISRNFYRQLGTAYGHLESWQFEPKEALRIFKGYIKEANIDYVINNTLTEVTKLNTTIQQIKTLTAEGTAQTIQAKVFIDATYEGDLMAMAGVSYTIGREGNATYQESYNGSYMPKYRAESSGYHQFPDHISPYKIANDPTSGLLFGVQEASLAPNGSADSFTQAYNFRICLTDSVDNQIPITRPLNYDSTKYELLVRLFDAQPQLREINDYFIWSRMPNRKTDINNRGAFSTDYIGANHRYPEASPQERQAIFQDHLDYIQGMLYFYATDKRVPKALQDYVQKWGYPKDEYQAYGNFTPQLYVREARRMVGEYVMTEHNCLGKEVVNDGIAYAAYTMDSHNTQRLIVNGMVKNEGNVEIGGFPPYPIAYRALVPKKQEVTNLIVPVCLSASHIAYGSIRMEPVFMLLGQVAGIAAAQSLTNNIAVQAVDYQAINALMERDPYFQNEFKDIVIDNTAIPETQGSSWTAKQHKTYVEGTVAVAQQQKELSVTIKDVKPGKYKIYYFTPVVADIYDDAQYTFTLNNKKIQVDLMDYLNDWFLIGEVDLTKKSSAELKIHNSSKLVFDAIQLVPNQ